MPRVDEGQVLRVLADLERRVGLLRRPLPPPPPPPTPGGRGRRCRPRISLPSLPSSSRLRRGRGEVGVVSGFVGSPSPRACGGCTIVTSTKLSRISRYQAPSLPIGTMAQPSRWLG